MIPVVSDHGYRLSVSEKRRKGTQGITMMKTMKKMSECVGLFLFLLTAPAITCSAQDRHQNAGAAGMVPKMDVQKGIRYNAPDANGAI